MWQRHSPDKAIEDLVEWLEDPCLSGYADQLLGNQTALSKETIDYVIEKLTGPLGCWESTSTEARYVLGRTCMLKPLAKYWTFWRTRP